jgi:hypothetical protein
MGVHSRHFFRFHVEDQYRVCPDFFLCGRRSLVLVRGVLESGVRGL